MSLASLLIVDDEAAQLTALSDTLQRHGYAVTGVAAGEDALRLLRTQSFDLLLTDLKLPGIDGISLLREALIVDPNLVAILMTGHGTIATAVEAMQVGALDYVLKPFKLSAVLPVLSRALSVRRLRVANAELEERVRERSAELEAVNQELDAFAFSVSHDLRAPLQIIIGFSDLLAEEYADALSTEVRRIVEHIRQAGRQGAQIVDDLLRFSRLGRQALSKRPVDVGQMVREVVDDLEKLEPERQIQVTVGVLPEANADAALLRHVFENLIGNAFKFTRGRSPAMIEVMCQEQAGEQVMVIRDNGAGFDMAHVDRLFGVFQRLHAQEEFAGTGVGLSLAQRIVQRHGGRIWAVGEVGKGATFSFTLRERPRHDR